MIDLSLYPTTPEIWYKIQRRKAETEAEMDKITRIFEKWSKQELNVKIPFTIYLHSGETMHRKVYITGFKTDGKDLFTEYQLIMNSPKFTQVITA